MANPQMKNSPITPPPKKAVVTKQYTASDLAKDAGLPNAAIARRHLRKSGQSKPADGWIWTSRDVAKPALEAVLKAVKAESAKN